MKILVIINNQIKNKRIEERIRRKLTGHNFSMAYTEYQGHATKIAQDAAKDGVDTIIAVGGDGTLNEIANGIKGSNVVLGIIPQGTANDLATHLSIPQNIESACDVIINRHLRLIDTISINNHICLTSCGIGVPERAAYCTDKIRSIKGVGFLLRLLLQSKLYILGLITSILKFPIHKYTVALSIRNKVVSSKLYSIIISNQPFIGNHFNISPTALCDDGAFDVFIINNNDGRIGVLRTILRTINGTHIKQNNVELFQEKELSLFFHNQISLLIDGEIKKADDNITIQILPKSINIITPSPI